MNRFKYVFPATFDYEEKGIAVSFPDLPGCVTCGGTGEEALAMAKEALGGYLAIAEEEGDPIPAPSDLSAIALAPNRRTVLVEVSMLDVRVEIRNRPVKKTLTIPE